MGTLVDDIRGEFSSITSCAAPRRGRAVPPHPQPAPPPPRTYEIKIEVVESTDVTKKIANVTISDSSATNALPNSVTDANGLAQFLNIPNNHTRTFTLSGYDQSRYRPVHASYSFHPALSGTGTIHRVTLVPIIRIYLKLQFEDPEGSNRNFPPGFTFKMRFEHTLHEKTVATAANGIINSDGNAYVEVPRSVKSFQLDFHQSHEVYFVCEKQGDPVAEAVLENAAQISGRITNDMNNLANFRSIKLPQTTWTLANSDWNAVGNIPAFNRAHHKFDTLELDATTIGSPAMPDCIVLDMHWQFTRFIYYDRWIKGENRISILPVMLEGFRDKAHMGSHADVKCNWACRSHAELRQCLPWIIQEAAHPKPDNRVLLKFDTLPHTYIESPVNRLPAGRRLINGAAQNTANADRLRFYDLPLHWKSQRYYCCIGPDNNDHTQGRRFENLPDFRGTIADPLAFCLDDMVLTDDHFNPVTWVPNNRAAIFSHLFNNKEYGGATPIPHALSAVGVLNDEGVYKPDTGNDLSFFTQVPATGETDRNYIVDYPDWTRLVIAKGDMFDVFDQRTANSSNLNRVVGARAAVRWHRSAGTVGIGNMSHPALDKSQPFFYIQPYYNQATIVRYTENFNDHHDEQGGRFDMALIRCCDVDNDDEVAVNFHFSRYSFFYRAAVPAHPPNPAIPAGDPSTDPNLSPADRVSKPVFENLIIKNVIARWNGNDSINTAGNNGLKNGTLLLPQDAANKIQIPVVWYGQAFKNVDLNLCHFKIDVVPDNGARDNRNDDGHGESSTRGYKPDGNEFATAHETGHVDSLPDEYNESWEAGSYGIISLNYNLPGDPFLPDDETDAAGLSIGAMMSNNVSIRNRFFWHCAEWARHALVNIAFKVAYDAYDQYLLPPHPRINRTYTYWPIKHKLDYNSTVIPLAHTINRGNIDLFLYALGNERYSVDILPASEAHPATCDGLLVVAVKIKCKLPEWNPNVPAPARPDLEINYQNRAAILSALNDARIILNDKFYLTGTVNAGAANEWVFNRCKVLFSPRFVVENYHNHHSDDAHNAHDSISVFRPDFTVEVAATNGLTWVSAHPPPIPPASKSANWIASHPKPEVIEAATWNAQIIGVAPAPPNAPQIAAELTNYHNMNKADLINRINKLSDVVALCTGADVHSTHLRSAATDLRTYLTRCISSKTVKIEYDITEAPATISGFLTDSLEAFLPGMMGIYKLPANIITDDLRPWLTPLNITGGNVLNI